MKHSAISRLLLVLAAAVLILALAACGGKPDGTEGSGPSEPPTPSPTASPAPTPTMKEEQINVYFTDDELMDLKEQKADIRYKDETGRIEAAFKALQQDGQDEVISLWKGIELLGAKEDSGAVILDIHIPDDVRLGAPGEELAIESITKTMFQFDEVKSIDILVDGEQIDSLMGHEDLEHPIQRQ